MKIIAVFFFIICFAFSGTVCAAQLNETIGSADQNISVPAVNSSSGIDAQTAMLGVGELVENVRAAFLYEANSNTLMYAMNADEQVYPASLVKIMTALLAVEKGELDSMVTVTESAVGSVPSDAVSADLVVGESLSLRDLLYCMLLGSANDAASVIAEYISGSQQVFVDEMNERAQLLGCTGTQFANAHGIHNESQYTTARDAARILNEALKNDDFYVLFTAKEYLVPATNMSENRLLRTGNYMMDATSKLYYDARVIGGRTGVTNDGRRCFAAAAEHNGMRLISIVMGTESVYQEDGYSVITIGGFQETTALLNAGFDGYKTAQILFANQTLKQNAVVDGDSDVVLGSRVSVLTVLPDSATMDELNFRYTNETFQAPIEAGQKLTEVEIWYGSTCVAKTDLYAMNSVESVQLQQIIAEDSDARTGWGTAGMLFAGLVICAFAVIILLRSWNRIKKMLASGRSKRYRRSRRRSR